jgi:hypothetical protein
MRVLVVARGRHATEPLQTATPMVVRVVVLIWRAPKKACISLETILSLAGLHQCSSMSEDSLAIHQSGEPDLFIRALELAEFPHLRHELITRPNGRCKPGAEFPQVCWVAVPDSLENCVSSAIVGEQAVHYGTAETERFAWLLRHVQAIVVSVETGLE